MKTQLSIVAIVLAVALQLQAQERPNILVLTVDDMNCDSFGNVIRALKESGVYDNTLIVFFSDHGMPFPFAKTAMYHHSTRTPLMVRWPDYQRPHDVMYWRRDDDYAIRKGDWRLAWNDASCPAGSDAMVFNLADDPGEYRDLSAQHPDIKQQLQDEFDAWDCRLPPSQCWGSPKNRRANPDATAEAPKRV